jgi:hypothetical protein
MYVTRISRYIYIASALSAVLRNRGRSLNVLPVKLLNSVVLDAQSVGGSAPCWVARKLQRHLQEKLWKGPWTRAVSRGAFIAPTVEPGSGRTHKRIQ